MLTCVTVLAQPVPLAKASPQLQTIKSQLFAFAQSNWLHATSPWSNMRRLESQMTAYGHINLPSFMEDMPAADAVPASYNASGYTGLELGVVRASLKVMGMAWPVTRWPVHVFTAGAMLCLLTSATCHLFGCCAQHVSQIIWRFDYVGIALLIVCSFYPPVYYGAFPLCCCITAQHAAKP